MATSQRKIESNRANAKKSPGPIDKTRTKLSALSHGLLAIGITQLDDLKAYRKLVRELKEQMNPVGALENFLLEAVALDLVRWPRARRFESQYITEILNPTKHERDPLGEVLSDFQGRVVDPGMPAALKPAAIQMLVTVYQRYETCFANRLFRTLHELDRLQRMRRGEYVSAPISVDVSVHAKAETHDSPPTAMEQPITAPVDGKSLAAPVTLDSNSQANKKRCWTLLPRHRRSRNRCPAMARACRLRSQGTPLGVPTTSRWTRFRRNRRRKLCPSGRRDLLPNRFGVADDEDETNPTNALFQSVAAPHQEQPRRRPVGQEGIRIEPCRVTHSRRGQHRLTTDLRCPDERILAPENRRQPNEREGLNGTEDISR